MIFPELLVKVVHTKPQTIKQISLCTANMLDQQEKDFIVGVVFFTMTTFSYIKEDGEVTKWAMGKVPDEQNQEKRSLSLWKNNHFVHFHLPSSFVRLDNKLKSP